MLDKTDQIDVDKIIPHLPIPAPTRIKPLSGGANNRVYKLEFEDQPSLVLKEYFQDTLDQRPRMLSEFLFLQYAWKSGLRIIPEPFFLSQPHNAALYSYVDGLPITPDRVDEGLVEQVIHFFLRLNENKQEALNLSDASEACFSLREFFEVTEKRILRLQSASELHTECDLKLFIQHELWPRWLEYKNRYKSKLDEESGKILSMSNRCVSPSDFGFHNALIQGSQLIFIDFEYAGWDDPCKTLCDLFCQPKIPFPKTAFPDVLNAFAKFTEDPESFFKRVELVYPVIQMKWCCIMLNGFTKIGRNRRTFSHSEEIYYLEKQLLLARELLQRGDVPVPSHRHPKGLN